MSSNANDVRLPFSHALTIHLVACVLFASGAVAALYDILEATGRDEPFSPSLKAWALAVHGGAVMIFLVLVGTVLPNHVLRAWKSRRNRISGSFFLAAIGVMIISGYGLLYFSGERLRVVTQWTHVIVGVCEPFLFVMHLILGRRTRARNIESANPT